MPYTKITYDIPFKYVMSKTKEALVEIVKNLTKKTTSMIDFKNTIVLPEKYQQKTTIYDLHFEIDDGTLFVIEMQNSTFNSELAQRFQAYESVLVHMQLKEGEGYQLKQAYCIVFLNNESKTHCLIEPYQIRHETDNHLYPDNVFNIILVHMNYIKEIKKEKSLKEMNIFERIVYALYYNLSYDILEIDDEVIKKMEENRQAFLSNEGGFLTMAERQWLDELERRGRERRYKETEKELELTKSKVSVLENQYRTLENQNRTLEGQKRTLDAKVDVLVDQNKILEDTNVQLMSEKEAFDNERESLVSEKKSLINERELFIQIVMRDKGFTRDQALLYIQGKRVYVSPIKKVKNFISRLHIF